MDAESQLRWLGEQIGTIVVHYVDDPNCAREFVDELCSDPKLKRKDVRINLVLLFAWGAMIKASELLGDYPVAAQLFTDRMCETVYDQLGMRVKRIEPLLHDRWTIYGECGFERGPEGLEELAKSFDACCGDTIADPTITRSYSLDPLRRMKIATEFAAFFSGIEKTFVKALG